jgi:hypothetical protein
MYARAFRSCGSAMDVAHERQARAYIALPGDSVTSVLKFSSKEYL